MKPSTRHRPNQSGIARLHLIILLAVVAVSLITVLILLNNPERKIHKRLEALAATVHLSGKESQVSTLKRTTEIVGFFTESCTLDFGSMTPEITNRGELRGFIARIRMHADLINVKIRGKTVTLEPGNQKASVELMLEGTVKMGKERANEFREYRLSMQHEDKWMIDRIESVRSITTPDQL